MTTATTVCAASLVFIPLGVRAVSCPPKVYKLDVTTTADAHDLVSALECTGRGVFNVSWTGSIAISERIEVSNGISLSITGLSASSTVPDKESVISEAVVDARGSTGIFSVSGGSILSLANLVLKGGSWELGGAIAVEQSYPTNSSTSINTVNAVDCTFLDNSVATHGGKKEVPCYNILKGLDCLRIYYLFRESVECPNL